MRGLSKGIIIIIIITLSICEEVLGFCCCCFFIFQASGSLSLNQFWAAGYIDFDFADNRRFWFFLEHAFFIKESLVVDRRLFEKKIQKFENRGYVLESVLWGFFFGGGGGKTVGDEP